MAPRNLHLLSLSFILLPALLSCPNLASSANTSFNFSSFASAALQNLTLLGDSDLRGGVLGLTRDTDVPSSSSGSMIYDRPIEFFDRESSTTASFSTTFAFSVGNVNPASFGDSLAFFLSPGNETLGSPGGYLGLVKSSQLTKNAFFAVEFDTRIDLHFGHPSKNHVGLDIDRLVSVKTEDPMLQGIDLKSGKLITAWIDYKNDQKKLMVFLSYKSFKPQDPLLMVDIDLSEYLKEISVTIKPPISVPESGSKHHKRLGLGLGIAGPAFFCVVLAVFGYIAVKKWRDIKIEKNFKAEVFAGPREFSYKELKTATKGFHTSRILGHGAFGTVYKAFFISSCTITAVKR
ncbi:hypothetical protein NL676_035222 [Syzygium grande]|nr:hypothetical protein NL676_035222 [Syzygium grande]